MRDDDPGPRRDVTEREVKLAAPPWFRLPELNGLGDGLTVEARPARRMSTVYFDTDDLRLARWGLSLRHRAGEGWTVKLPAAAAGATLVRTEHVFAGGRIRPPAEAVDLVTACVRGRELAPQVRLRTTRRPYEVHGADGNVLAELVDDSVSVVDAQPAPGRFREIEVEAKAADAGGVLAALEARLRRAGADGATPTPKYVQALGARLAMGPEVEVVEPGECASAAEVVRSAVAASVVRLIRHDPIVRLDSDPEGVHQARVATRRLRSDLRTFAPLCDPEWAHGLREELKWLGGMLGTVRDADVLLEGLRRRAAALPDASVARGAQVVDRLAAERERALEALLEALRSERYVALLDALVDAARHPRLLEMASLPAVDVLGPLARRSWEGLQRRVRSLPDRPADEDLHRVRIHAKRCRYAAEATEPVLGKPVRRLARRAARLQSVLGDLNDAIVAEQWLRDAARRMRSTRVAFVAGELAAMQRAEARGSRDDWPAAWKQLRKAGARAWA